MTDAAQDPHQEPSGGEVEGWMGQEVAQDRGARRPLIAEEGGDVLGGGGPLEEESRRAPADDESPPGRGS
jgi:hypothetical protein